MLVATQILRPNELCLALSAVTAPHKMCLPSFFTCLKGLLQSGLIVVKLQNLCLEKYQTYKSTTMENFKQNSQSSKIDPNPVSVCL